MTDSTQSSQEPNRDKTVAARRSLGEGGHPAVEVETTSDAVPPPSGREDSRSHVPASPVVGGLHTTLEGPRAELRLQVGWGDIPGRPVLHQTVFFDGTPDGFDAAIEKMKVDFREEAQSPLRPCGHAGPWHESVALEDRLLRPDDDRDL